MLFTERLGGKKMDRSTGGSLKSAVRDVLDLTGRLVDKLGPRVFGSASCARAADEIATEMGRYCDSVHKEQFTAHPGAFWHSPKVISLAYIAGSGLLIVGGEWVYLSILFFLIDLLLVLNFIFYAHLTDPFFPKIEGTNVIGTIEPAGPVTQQVILIGHHDSTYVYTLMARLPKLFLIRYMGAFFFLFIGFCTSLLFSFYRLAYQTKPTYSGVLLIVLLAGLLFIVPFFFSIGRKGSPGAGDNLVACMMGIKIPELLSDEHSSRPLQRTRVRILSTDGEEPGLLGAEAFARLHREELLDVKTFALNLDSIYKAHELTLVTKDRNSTIRLSAAMAEDCRRIATELGLPVRMCPFPPFGGASDAARFAEIGVEALTITGMSIPPNLEELGYHTPNDTVERIEPAAVEAGLHIAYRYILEKDRLG
jgi:hypothetical protein